MNFNKKFIELRKSKGLSQDELGNELGVSRTNNIKVRVGAKIIQIIKKLVLLSDY